MATSNGSRTTGKEGTRTLRRTEIVSEPCPQCGFRESVCETRSPREGKPNAPRFTACPRCGCAEEKIGKHRQHWKGYGVFVLQSENGVVRAGAFPRAIPDSKVSSIVAHLRASGASLQFVSRWNDNENRLEVLVGADR